MDCIGSDFRFPLTVVSFVVIATVANAALVVVVVVVGTVVAGVVIGVVVNVVLVIAIAVVLSDSWTIITASAICTIEC